MYQLQNNVLSLEILLVILLLMACNGSMEKREEAAPGNKPATVQDTAKNSALKPVIGVSRSGAQGKEIYHTCEALITDLVSSSNAVALADFKAVKVRIDEVTAEKIIIELFTVNDVSEDPFVERKADRTVGWLEFFPATAILQDITNDPENPERLHYNAAIIQAVDWDKLCKVRTEKNGQ